MFRLRRLLFSALIATFFATGCTDDLTKDLPDCAKCDHLDDGPSDDLTRRWRGQSQFETSSPFWDFFPLNTLKSASTLEGAAAPDRSVEEADIYRHDDAQNRLYVLNSYRGLQIIDVSNPDQPNMLGRAPLGGYPIDMYQRGDHAYVLLNSRIDRQQTGGDDNFQGAVLRVYDLSDPTAPLQTAEFEIAGNVSGSRLLSTDDGSSAVIYVASNVYSWQAGISEQKVYVMSIDVTNPNAPFEVDREDFDGAGWQSHVTPEAMFLAQYDWSDDDTRIRYIDISDLSGDIVIRDQIEIDGRLGWGDRGELQMSFHDGHLRVASDVRGNFATGQQNHIRISTIDAHDADSLSVAGELDLGEGHRLVATRFSGDRAYLFHMVQVDPLEVIDLSNPAAPESMGILKIDGWVNHIEVRGDKLLTLGVNDATDRKIAFMLFDVSDPNNPVELDRATTGENWAWTSATHDIKQFSIFDDLGLAMIPVSSSSWDEVTGYSSRRWMQLFSFDMDSGDVASRGEVDNVGGIRRAFAAGNRVLAFSDLQLQSVDVSNADKPEITGSLELARNVFDFTTVGPFGVMAVADGDFSGQTTEMRVVSLHDPDNTAPLAVLGLEQPRGTMYKLDEQHLIYLSSDPNSGDTIISTLNFTDPLAPKVIGEMKLGELGFRRWNRFISWGSAPASDISLVGDNLVIFTWPQSGEQLGGKLRVISFANRAFPHQSAVVNLGAGTIADMRAEGSKLYVSSYAPVENIESDVDPSVVPFGTSDIEDDMASAASLLPGGRIAPFRRSSRVAYDLRIIDLADPNAPVVSDAISVPGKYVGQSQLGEGEFAVTLVYTTDQIALGGGPSAAAIDTAMLVGTEKVRLVDVFGLPAGASDIRVEGQTAVFTSSGWWSGPFFLGLPGTSLERPAMKLHTLDLTRADSIEEASAVEVEGASFGNLGNLADGLAFVSGGWQNLFVYDVSDPRNVQLVGEFPTLSWWSGNVYDKGDGRVYLPSGLFGLDVIDVR